MTTSVDKCFSQEQIKALYPRLRPGPHGSERDHQQVLSHQRARLHGAMVEAVAQRGYAAVTVHQLVTLAGVSKRSFYEHFASKEQCFIATFEVVAAEALQRMLTAADGRIGWHDRFAAMLDAALDAARANPNAARLCMVEAFALGPAGRRQVARACAGFEQALADAAEQRGAEHDEYGPVLAPLAIKGIVHGVCHVIRSQLLTDNHAILPTLNDELLAWASSYAHARGAYLHAAPGAAPGTSMLRPVNGNDPRHRLQRAALLIVGRKGWLALDRCSLSRMARMEEAAVVEVYDDVQTCFLEALDLMAVEALATMLSAARAASAPHAARPQAGEHSAHANRAIEDVQAVPAAIRALTDLLAREPAVARAMFLESLSAGPATVKHGTKLLYGFAGLLRRSVPEAHRLSVPVSQAIVGAVWGTIQDYVAAGATARLPQLAGHLSYLMLAPVMGAHAAIQAIGMQPAGSTTEPERLSATGAAL